MPWLILSVAIISEVIATSALTASEGFTKWNYGAVSIIGYLISFYALSIVLKSIPVGVAYAVWSGVGVALLALIGVLFFDQKLNVATLVGLGLIIAGVVVLNVASGAVVHEG